VKVCIEYKISDPMARCVFGSAGETLAFCLQTGIPNLGITLDFGHSLLAGERPAQAAALLSRAGKLYYVHLNDNDGAWDWDMLPGAYHMWQTVEFLYTLRRLGYEDDWFAFDVAPKEVDTVFNFAAAMKLTRKLEGLVDRIDPARMDELMRERNPARTAAYLYDLL
jgi:xylose isomerase